MKGDAFCAGFDVPDDYGGVVRPSHHLFVVAVVDGGAKRGFVRRHQDTLRVEAAEFQLGDIIAVASVDAVNGNE